MEDKYIQPKKSTHQVEVIRIKEIDKHPNADLLGIVRPWGFTCCVKLGDFEIGDLAAYIVPDSVVPDTPGFAFLDGHFRIRVKKLRGIHSQGLLIKAPEGAKEGDDVAGVLGITHYETPLPFETGGEAEGGPSFSCPKYDVESWHRYCSLFVPEEQVVITEKVHGCSARYTFASRIGEEPRMFCGSRTEWKRQDEKNLWWLAAIYNRWIEDFCRKNPGLVLYGEVFGNVQNLKYGVGQGEAPRFLAFDVFEPREWLWWPWDRLIDSIGKDDWMVPCIYQGKYDRELCIQLSQGKSFVPGANNIKEGVVIQPAIDRNCDEIGRLKLKIVSDEYLSGP